MSVYPYITSAGTDKYKKTIGTAQDAFETLNQFEQNDVIVSSGVQSVNAGANIIVDNTDPQNPIVIGENGGIQTITAGSNITITGTASNPIVNGENGGVQTITAGPNITITGTATDPIITSSGVGPAITLSSTLAGTSLVNDGVGPDLVNKDLAAGTGISLSSSATLVTIALASPVGFSVTLNPNGANNGTIVAGDDIGSFPVSTVAWLANWNDGNFNTTTGVYTTPSAGRYLCMFQLSTDGSSDIGYLVRNGITIFSSAGQITGTEACVGGTYIYDFGAGPNAVSLRCSRTAAIRVYPRDASAGAIFSGGTFFAMYKLF